MTPVASSTIYTREKTAGITQVAHVQIKPGLERIPTPRDCNTTQDTNGCIKDINFMASIHIQKHKCMVNS